MAKPGDPPAPPAPAPSPRRRPRRRSRLSARRPAPAPSSALLALFATVAASADGHPLSTYTCPPDFLCPQLGIAPFPAPTPPFARRPRGISGIQQNASSSASPTITSSGAQLSTKTQPVADKYVSCDDGRWRKTDVWTLYGSTFCSGGVCTATPTGTSTTVFCGSSTSSSVLSSTTGSLNVYPSGDIDTYPSGWLSSNELHDDKMTPVIISLSVILALSICIFIVMCVLWRRKRLPKLKDPEKRSRAKDGVTDETDPIELNHFLSQQRLLAKAAAKWKAGIRQSARRRRKRQGAHRDGDSQLLAETSAHTSSTSLHRSHTHTSSRSVVSDSISMSQVEAPEFRASSSLSSRVNAPSPHRPPAYPSGTSVTASQARHGFQQIVLPSLADSGRSTDSVASNSALQEPPAANDQPTPYHDFIHTGHVATDDKTLLARMTELASAPPPADASSASCAEYPSVPPLEDEFEGVPSELRVIDCDMAESDEALGSRQHLSPVLPPNTPSYSREVSPCSPALPPPPVKGRLVAPTFYDYPASFEEDIFSSEPEMGPSAPPFAEDSLQGASAPPLDLEYVSEDMDVLPSAPPLEETDWGSMPEAAPDGQSDDFLRIEQPLPLRRTTNHLHISAWHSTPPRYLP